VARPSGGRGGSPGVWHASRSRVIYGDPHR
jgi:hypothetical protein